MEAAGGGDNGVTALRFEDQAGMLLATGNDAGEVRLFDLRSSRPVIVKDHNSGTRSSFRTPPSRLTNRLILRQAAARLATATTRQRLLPCVHGSPQAWLYENGRHGTVEVCVWRLGGAAAACFRRRKSGGLEVPSCVRNGR
jgi:hypothetical protein